MPDETILHLYSIEEIKASKFSWNFMACTDDIWIDCFSFTFIIDHNPDEEFAILFADLQEPKNSSLDLER